MKIYNKFMLVSNIIMTIIFMIPITILFINIVKLNFNYQEIKYSLAASIFGIVYLLFSWHFYRLQKE
ncbi:Uncharacterised protein [Clostridium tertium]|uniref:Uncharacterized protein n=1 Tax=Clostridium tertium TaxID=1559 RepID=A0A6N3DQN4_9CLOT